MFVQSPASRYDIVIVGGGMVGASFALLMCQQSCPQPVSVLVVEAAPPDAGIATSPGFDDRSTALSFGSRGILAKIGLWSALADAATPILGIHVSDRGHFGSARLDHKAQGVEALGYVVENRSFGRTLGNALQDNEGLDLLAPARVSQVKPMPAGMLLQLEGNGDSVWEVEAGLVVLADGGRSPICSKLGIEFERQAYGQQALIANLAHEKPHQNVAYERFTDTGPLAILPLKVFNGENRGALIWTLAENEADELMVLDDPALIPILQERFGYRLGRIERLGQRACYPLSLQVAREQVRPGLVLLGNVAHTLHPVAGQGFNLALRDAECLANTVAAGMARGEQPGSMALLQTFQRNQSRDQDRTIRFSHYLTRLFSTDTRGLVWARKFGLASIDLVPVVRSSFARTAMGLADR